MNPQWIIRSLRGLYKSFHEILEDDAQIILDEAVAEVEVSKQQYDQRKRCSHDRHPIPQPWGYRIDPDRPLKFRTSNAARGLEPRVDVYSTVLWMDENELPTHQNTHIRVWSNSDHAFRESLDAPNVLEKLTDLSREFSGRVMWRCHFDLAERGQPGPQYHLQFGGNARSYELCWLPEIIDMPRLATPPMDLILVCQLVAANFFWDKYHEFRESPEWISVLGYSQEHLLRDYYEKCLRAVKDNNAVLDQLWNI